MAAITSIAANGNWSATGTWAGGVVPGVGDTVIFADGSYTITVDSDTTVGASGATGSTAAIAWPASPTGGITLAIAAGKTLRVQGDVAIVGNQNTPYDEAQLTLAAGASFIIDPAASQTYKILFNQYENEAISCNGTSGSRCTFKTDLARGGNPAFMVVNPPGAGFAWCGLKTCTYTDFSNFSSTTAGTYGLVSWIDTLRNPPAAISVTNCTFTACTYEFSLNTRLWDGNLTFTHNIQSTSPTVTTLGVGGICAAFLGLATAISSVRNMSFNSFDGAFMTTSSGLPIHDNVMAGGYQSAGSPTWPDDTYFYNNVIAIPDTSAPGFGGSIKDCYILKTSTAANPHYIAGALNSTITGCLFEYPNANHSDGDMIFPPGGTGTFKVIKCFGLPNNGATGVFSGSGKLVSGIGPTAGTAVTLEHNFSWGRQGDAAALCQMGETQSATFAGNIASCKANLIFDPNTGGISNYFIADTSTTPATDMVTAADYNASAHPTTGSITAAGSSVAAVGYNLIKVTAAGIAGAGGTNTQVGLHDFVADPQFADQDYRVIAKWGAKRRGTAQTYAGAMAALQADPTLVADLIFWVPAGYAPTNQAFANATYPGDAMTTDANGNALGGAVGPMAVQSAYQPWIYGDQVQENYG